MVVMKDGQTHWLDVVVTEPLCEDQGQRRARVRKYGLAAENAEKAKHEEYGPEVVPFALETGGRWGALARAW